ncbi:MAG: hypothetical protein KatS3mg121_1539 [Gammaproteobacteria bacterium]|nr:MAG: hypothetical protein KatS3mg121_1539 [Gammaproteobacteria bacterium]
MPFDLPAEHPWRPILDGAGARLGAHGLDFGDDEAERRAVLAGTALAPLTDRALLRATGEDAASFLHNQLAADLRGLGADAIQPAAYCNPQGRVIALPWLWRDDGGFWLSMPRELAEPVAARLARYILRSKVRLAAEADRLGLGVAGGAALARLSETLGPAPPVGRWRRHGALDWLRLPGTARCVLWGPAADIAALFEALRAAGTPAVGPDAWALADLELAIPEVWPETSERFLPQALGLERLGAVSLRKGCYPGQEVIARLHYRGQIKRRLYRFGCAQGAPPPRAAALWPAAAERHSAIGEVADARRRPGGGVLGLAVARSDSPAAVLEDGRRLDWAPAEPTWPEA